MKNLEAVLTSDDVVRAACAVDDLTIEIANTSDCWTMVDDSAPIQPTQVRHLSSGPPGAEWVRYVADYQDYSSVGYMSLDDLAEECEWHGNVHPEFEAVNKEG